MLAAYSMTLRSELDIDSAADAVPQSERFGFDPPFVE